LLTRLIELSTQHENILFSPQALNKESTLPGMSRRRDIVWRLPSDFKGKYPDGQLGPNHIDLFIFQILVLKPNRESPIEPLLDRDFLSAQY